MYRIAAYSRWFYCTPQTISTIPDGRRRITASAIGNKRIEIKTKVEAVLVSKKNNVFYPFSYLAWIRRSAGGRRRPFCWDEALAGRQKPCRARPNSHQDESLSGCRWHEKGTEVFYFCLLSVCILIICIGICVGFGAAFLAVLFILRPDGKTVRSGSAVHAVRRAHCFGVHFRPTKGVYGLALQETALPCVTCRRYSDRAPEAPS